MKRKSNIYYKELNLKNIYFAFSKVKSNIGNKKELFNFILNKNTNLMNIYNKLYNRNYKFNKYHIFLIKEPKYRLVMSENIEDKIVNHFIAEFYLRKYIDNSLIYSNVATRIGKGSKLALDLFEKYIEKDSFILKVDISKYFYNIDHNVLIYLLSKKIKDKYVINIIKDVLDTTGKDYINKLIKEEKLKEIKFIKRSNLSLKEKNKKINEINKIPYYNKAKGISIGNMTSQILAVYFLNEVDHFIKENLCVKKYIRYMDDLVIIDNNYKRLKNIEINIRDKIEEYNLKINNKTNIYNINNGVEFLGYKFKYKNNKILIKYNNQTLKRIKRRLKYLKKNNLKGYIKSISSYNGFLDNGNTKLKERFKLNSFKNLYSLYKEKYPEYVIMIKVGKFYKSKDAEIFNYLFDYQIKEEVVGFPNIDKIKEVFNKRHVNYIYIDEEEHIKEFKDNDYLHLKSVSEYESDRKDKIDSLSKKIEIILNKDIKSYIKINETLELILMELLEPVPSKLKSS